MPTKKRMDGVSQTDMMNAREQSLGTPQLHTQTERPNNRYRRTAVACTPVYTLSELAVRYPAPAHEIYPETSRDMNNLHTHVTGCRVCALTFTSTRLSQAGVASRCRLTPTVERPLTHRVIRLSAELTEALD